MKSDIKVRLQLADQHGVQIRIERVVVDALLYVSGKQRYRFDAGSTDNRGSLTISFEDLERSRVLNQSFAIMDYNTPLTDCDPRIDIAIPSEKELSQRIESSKKWFPTDISRQARLSGGNNAKIRCDNLTLDLTAISEDPVLLLCDVQA
jgi:hypothetical protein